jgi:hypothetical protein
LESAAFTSIDEQIHWTYRQVLGRAPTLRELELSTEFVGQDGSRWSLLYQALFQSLDFRYVN